MSGYAVSSVSAFWCGTVTGLGLGSLCYLFARPLLSIYITDSPQAIEYGH